MDNGLLLASYLVDSGKHALDEGACVCGGTSSASWHVDASACPSDLPRCPLPPPPGSASLPFRAGGAGGAGKGAGKPGYWRSYCEPPKGTVEGVSGEPPLPQRWHGGLGGGGKPWLLEVVADESRPSINPDKVHPRVARWLHRPAVPQGPR